MTYQPLHYRTDVGRPTIWSRLAGVPRLLWTYLRPGRHRWTGGAR